MGTNLFYDNDIGYMNTNIYIYEYEGASFHTDLALMAFVVGWLTCSFSRLKHIFNWLWARHLKICIISRGADPMVNGIVV